MKTVILIASTLLLGLFVPLAGAAGVCPTSSTCVVAGAAPGDCTGASPDSTGYQCAGVRNSHTRDWTCVGSYVHAGNGVEDCTGVLVFNGRVYVLWTRVA